MSNASFEAVLKECGLTEKWIAEGRKEGWKDGRKEGWEKGREEGRGDAVKQMRKHGMAPKQISEVLELPRRTVSRYLKVK